MGADTEVEKDFLDVLNTLKSTEENVTHKNKLQALNKLIKMSSSIRDVGNFCNVADFLKCLCSYIASTSRSYRISTLRVLRLYMTDTTFIQELVKLNMHYFIAWSLDKDKHGEKEKLQAMKLVRKIIEINASLLPRAITQVIVSTAEHKDDVFSRVCLHTLCELALKNPRVVAECNGIKIIANAVIERSPFSDNLQEALLGTILFLCNDSETRQYLRLPSDLRVIVAPLTDAFTNEMNEPEKKERSERWKASKKALVYLTKSWTGLICLAADNFGLSAMVHALRQPCLELNEIAVDGLYDIFRLNPPKNDPFVKQKTKKSELTNQPLDVMGPDLPYRSNYSGRQNLLDNYITAILLAFVNCGVLEGLIDLGNELRNETKDDTEKDKETKQQLAFKTTALIGELLDLSNTHLPSSQCARIQTLPLLVKHGASFNLDPRHRSRASTMITLLHQYSHIKGSSLANEHINSQLALTGSNKWRRVKGRDRRLDRIDEVKMKMDINMDDATFNQKLRESQVLAAKDWNRWKWEVITELLEGPLTNPIHLAVALKNKFMKRLLSFLRPSSKCFSVIQWNVKYLKFVRIACNILEVLLSGDQSAVSFLAENKLVTEIAELLRIEVDIENKKPVSQKAERLLTQEGVLKTMAREYFTMLGTLSSYPSGVEIMHKNKIFDYLMALSVSGRDDLNHYIMTSLDYNMSSGESREVLKKSLTSPSKVIRYHTIRHLRSLLRSCVNDFNVWGVELLVKQILDPDPKVAGFALDVLNEACDDSECLESLIKLCLKSPTDLEKMGKNGKELMIRFLSRNSGFTYLQTETTFIQTELTSWRNTDYMNYVRTVDNCLNSAFTSNQWRQKSAQEVVDVVFLTGHFYGELASTEKGCAVLKEAGHFPEFVSIVKNDKSSPLERRGALWVMGHVGKSSTGLQLLIDSDIIPYIVRLGEESPNLSLRGTCFFVFGMISASEKGKEILESLGWQGTQSLSICVPKDFASNPFFKIPSYKHQGSWANNSPEVHFPQFPKDDPRSELLLYVGNLSNHITTETASKVLKRLRIKNPELFQSPEMFVHTLRCVENYKYRLPIRQFIFSLFDGIQFKEEHFRLFNELGKS